MRAVVVPERAERAVVVLETSSVPAWALTPEVGDPDPSGRSSTLLVVGGAPSAGTVADRWQAQLAGVAGHSVVRHDVPDVPDAVVALRADLAAALVGHRVLVTGSARACLAVRAAALAAGAEDDELVLAAVEVAERSLWCPHCAAVTTTTAALEGSATCSGCARTLVVHPHVSRLTGHHLGYDADAERLP